MLYETGRGVAVDFSEAIKWYRAATEGGDSIAPHSLANMYRVGRGVARDHAEAMQWFRKAGENLRKSLEAKQRR